MFRSQRSPKQIWCVIRPPIGLNGLFSQSQTYKSGLKRERPTHFIFLASCCILNSEKVEPDITRDPIKAALFARDDSNSWTLLMSFVTSLPEKPFDRTPPRIVSRKPFKNTDHCSVWRNFPWHLLATRNRSTVIKTGGASSMAIDSWRHFGIFSPRSLHSQSNHSKRLQIMKALKANQPPEIAGHFRLIGSPLLRSGRHLLDRMHSIYALIVIPYFHYGLQKPNFPPFFKLNKKFVSIAHNFSKQTLTNRKKL